jgi:hypothetical protein
MGQSWRAGRSWRRSWEGAGELGGAGGGAGRELEAELGRSWDGALDGGWEAEQARKKYLHIYFFDLMKKCLSEPKNV